MGEPALDLAIVKDCGGHGPSGPAFAPRLRSTTIRPASPGGWGRRHLRAVDHEGRVVYELAGAEFPLDWSDQACTVVAQRYFARGSAAPETSLAQVLDRICTTIGRRAGAGGWVDPADLGPWQEAVAGLLMGQVAAFNSPVWFNIGVPGVPQQAASVFVIGVEGTFESVLAWPEVEAHVFNRGGGAGAALSKVRGAGEIRPDGGRAAGPVAFMRAADAVAGAVEAGGRTGRAAKMVVLHADHPDIESFVGLKAYEEGKAHALHAAGYAVGIGGADRAGVPFQNANNSVRATDAFMEAVVADARWELRSPGSGQVLETVPARRLMRSIAEAAWACGDPGMQFDDTINAWHTAPSAGRINASSSCSEFLHVDDSAANLASLNLMRFLADDGTIDIDGIRRAVDLLVTAQDVLVDASEYPSEAIATNARRLRPIGVGYANLGGLLMALGLAYDSDEGRGVAAAVTSLVSAQAWLCSARLASRLGAFEGYATDRGAVLRVLERHRSAHRALAPDSAPDTLLAAAATCWDQALDLAHVTGVRNSQVTMIAPTGTIGMVMECDTSGIEPELALCRVQHFTDGTVTRTVNRLVPRALRSLGHAPDDIDRIVAALADGMAPSHVPGLPVEHVAVFATAMGDDAIAPDGHIEMMAAVQPFVSGAISKTVNLPATATVEDVERVFVRAWRLGLKAVAVYRDGCKVAQPLTLAPPSSEPGWRSPR